MQYNFHHIAPETIVNNLSRDNQFFLLFYSLAKATENKIPLALLKQIKHPLPRVSRAHDCGFLNRFQRAFTYSPCGEYISFAYNPTGDNLFDAAKPFDLSPYQI